MVDLLRLCCYLFVSVSVCGCVLCVFMCWFRRFGGITGIIDAWRMKIAAVRTRVSDRFSDRRSRDGATEFFGAWRAEMAAGRAQGGARLLVNPNRFRGS